MRSAIPCISGIAVRLSSTARCSLRGCFGRLHGRIAVASVLGLLASGWAEAADRPAQAGEPPDRTSVPAVPAPNTPAPPADPAAAEVARAIREARKELEAVELQAEREARELTGRIAEETQTLLALREEEKKLSERLRALDADLSASQAKAAWLDEAAQRSAQAVKAVESELTSQAGAFRERFAGSLAAAADPKLLESATEALNPNLPLRERVTSLLEAYEKALRQAGSVATVRLPLLLSSSAEERVEKMACLRIGLIGGLYARPSRGEGGFVVSDPDSKTGFLAESKGLDREQMQRIIGIVQKPEKGGVVPADVTGGAAIASLRARETLGRWFERGGTSMYVLAALAALAAAVGIPRALILAVRRTAIVRRSRRIIDLIAAGQADAAAAAAKRRSDAAGVVLGAVLECRDLDRTAMEAAFESALAPQTRRLRAGLGIVSLCGALAPLVGFLGTAGGMLGAFRMLEALGYSDARFLAGGVAQSLVATEAGLYVAIPCLIMRVLLGSLADGAAEKLEASGLSAIIGLLKQREASVEVGGAA